jgi:hypothetical protein
MRIFKRSEVNAALFERFPDRIGSPDIQLKTKVLLEPGSFFARRALPIFS